MLYMQMLSRLDPHDLRAPVAVEHAAVGATGQQAGWCGRGGAGLGHGCPLQEGVGVEGLDGDLLQAVCFCWGRAGVASVILVEGSGSRRHAGGLRQLLTQAVLGDRHIPLGSCKLLLALGAAAVSRLWHWATRKQLVKQGGPHLLQLSVCCHRKTPVFEAKGPGW